MSGDHCAPYKLSMVNPSLMSVNATEFVACMECKLKFKFKMMFTSRICCRYVAGASCRRLRGEVDFETVHLEKDGGVQPHGCGIGSIEVVSLVHGEICLSNG